MLSGVETPDVGSFKYQRTREGPNALLRAPRAHEFSRQFLEKGLANGELTVWVVSNTVPPAYYEVSRFLPGSTPERDQPRVNALFAHLRPVESPATPKRRWWRFWRGRD